MHMGATSVRRTALSEKVYAKAAEMAELNRLSEEIEAQKQKLRERKKRGPYHQSPYAKMVAEQKRATLENVVRAAISYFGYSEDELLATTHQPDVVYARHVAFYVAYKHGPKSFQHIGKRFQRDHTTVLHGFRRIRGMLDDGDRNVSNDIEQMLLLTLGIRVEDQPYWGC